MNNKIDSYSELANTSIDTKMKPIYGTSYELNCGTIEYYNKIKDDLFKSFICKYGIKF